MKAAAFELDRPRDLAEALDAMRHPESRIMAGGQSLGPMLNFRLARPSRIVSIAALPELAGASETEDAVTIGACVTHAAIADGRTPDLAGSILAGVADNIAYRAIRNRGTIGGSLCHADPAADWPCVLLALGASVIVTGPDGSRMVPLVQFITGAFRIALAPGELVQAVRIPRPSASARWGFYKACRKPGEFAHAMAAVLIDGTERRAVIGAVGGRPVVLRGDDVAPAAVQATLQDSGLDAIGCHMQGRGVQPNAGQGNGVTRIDLTVNGRAVSAEVEPRTHLADFLRESLLLTGTHLGCEHGVCGACTVLLDNEPVRSCITYAALCGGAAVCSIEGLEDDAVATTLRAAFSEEHALQCGYCTPGMLVTARDIIRRLPGADDDRIRLELAGNLCRCTGYNGIVKAIRRVLNAGVAEPVAAPPAAMRKAVFDLTVDSPGSIRSSAEIDNRMRQSPDFQNTGKPDANLLTDNGRQNPESTVKPNSAMPAPAPIQPDSRHLSQTLRIALPVDVVWTAIQNPTLVASCIPGAHLTAVDGDRIEGEMLASLGPIRAKFAGHANLEFDQDTHNGRITGEGRDSGGGSRLSGAATFAVQPEGPDATLIRLEMRYALRGALAQFGRGPVVQVFASEIVAAVASRLDAKLRGGEAIKPETRFSLGQVLIRIVWQAIRRWLPKSGG